MRKDTAFPLEGGGAIDSIYNRKVSKLVSNKNAIEKV